jgi:hypothetical protein
VELRGRRSFVFDYQAHQDPARAAPGSPAAELAGPAGGAAASLALRGYPMPPMAAAWGGRGSWGRDLLGLQPRHFDRLSGLVMLTDDAALRARLLALASVERVVALHDAGFEPLGPPRLVPGPLPLRVFDVPGALPRAYAVGRALGLPDAEAELRLATGRLDVGREVLLEEGAGSGASRAFSFPPQVRQVAERADRLAFEVELPADGWLVLNDLWAPGWLGRVDGRAARVARANLLFRAVAVPAGRHHVLLVYRPRGLLPALGCTAVAALAALLVALRASADSAGGLVGRAPALPKEAC